MGKSSGGNRQGGGKIVGFSESEKAIQIEVRYMANVAPKGGYVSSQVREVSGTTKVWVPKTQIENGNLSEWIASQKRGEIEDYITSKRYMNAQVVRMNTSFNDATGKSIKVKPTKKESQFKKEREAKQKAALDKATKERTDLITQAKANGYSAHSKMSTATLTKMANGTYKSKAEQKRKRSEELAKLRNARSKMVKIK